ncbi:MAG: glutathione S-transferase family protein [Pikeienuella sp.]
MYTMIGSPRNRGGRVMWMLEEIGEDYEVVDVFPHTDKIKEHNPSGKVPALLDDGEVIIDSTAILLHLADKHNKLTFPLGSIERARMYSMINFALDDFEGPLWTMAKHTFVLPEKVRVKEAITPAAMHEYSRAMKTLEARLGDNTFAVGDQFSVADIIIGHCGGWAKNSGFPMPEGKVGDYITRIRSRDGWKAVLQRQKKQG